MWYFTLPSIVKYVCLSTGTNLVQSAIVKTDNNLHSNSRTNCECIQWITTKERESPVHNVSNCVVIICYWIWLICNELCGLGWCCCQDTWPVAVVFSFSPIKPVANVYIYSSYHIRDDLPIVACNLILLT